MTQNNAPVKEEQLLKEISKLKAVLNEMYDENSEITEEKIKISRNLDQLITEYMRLKKSTLNG